MATATSLDQLEFYTGVSYYRRGRRNDTKKALGHFLAASEIARQTGDKEQARTYDQTIHDIMKAEGIKDLERYLKR
jgi:hypothetical protein